MVRGPRISADLSGSGAAPVGSGGADRQRAVYAILSRGELIAVRGTFQLEGGRRIVAGLTVNKNKKKPAVSGLNLSYERVLVYAFNSILGGTLAPVETLTF